MNQHFNQESASFSVKVSVKLIYSKQTPTSVIPQLSLFDTVRFTACPLHAKSCVEQKFARSNYSHKAFLQQYSCL